MITKVLVLFFTMTLAFAGVSKGQTSDYNPKVNDRIAQAFQKNRPARSMERTSRGARSNRTSARNTERHHASPPANGRVQVSQQRYPLSVFGIPIFRGPKGDSEALRQYLKKYGLKKDTFGNKGVEEADVYTGFGPYALKWRYGKNAEAYFDKDGVPRAKVGCNNPLAPAPPSAEAPPPPPPPARCAARPATRPQRRRVCVDDVRWVCINHHLVPRVVGKKSIWVDGDGPSYDQDPSRQMASRGHSGGGSNIIGQVIGMAMHRFGH